MISKRNKVWTAQLLLNRREKKNYFIYIQDSNIVYFILFFCDMIHKRYIKKLYIFTVLEEINVLFQLFCIYWGILKKGLMQKKLESFIHSAFVSHTPQCNRLSFPEKITFGRIPMILSIPELLPV